MLTANAIKFQVERGAIVIDPYDENKLQPNSYDLCMGDKVAVYGDHGTPYRVLDPKRENLTTEIEVSPHGLCLSPARLYLATTKEYTESHKHIPMVNGRSSLARLGLSIHQTGGFGDLGFCGRWVLEISVVQSVIIYPGMPIAQICWFEPSGLITKKYTGKYQGQSEITPCKIHEEL